ncbi:MAG: peptide deformylase [Hyphomicrobiales bacterium]
MALLDIVKIPDAVLRKVCAPVEEITPDMQKLFDDMLATMYDAPGIGLAAPQIGILKRIMVIDIVKEEDEDDAPREKDPMVFVNPEIVWESEELNEYEEGCLSIPEVYENVTRPAQVTVAYLDHEGKQQRRDCDGLLATCVQHEIDHLNGVLFIDYISKLKRDRIVKKFAKAKKLAEAG